MEQKSKTLEKMDADLPEELITTHILPRLPVKSIGRCRCVSKPWRSLLSTPEFAKTHLKFHTHGPDNLIFQCLEALQIATFTGKGAVSRKLNVPSFEAFTDDAIPPKVKRPLSQKHIIWSLLVGSCDGLILLRMLDMYFGAILVNPITLEYVNLPEVSDPSGKFLCYGLGYDRFSDDYKVVKLSQSRDCHYSQKRVDVYSVKMKCWRRIGHTPYHHENCKSGVFLNGCIHWMVVESLSESGPIVTIASFNLAREEFDQIPLPSGVVVCERGALDIKVLKDRLTLIHTVYSKWGPVDVWVMEEYGVSNSWTKLTTIIWPENKNLFARCEILCILNGDEIIVERVIDSQLLAYNWRTRVWRDVVVAGYKGTCGISTIMTFRESIVSPNSQMRA